jgi:hypothetical protein
MLMTAPPAALDHPRQVASQQIDRGHDEQVHLLELTVASGLHERRVDAVPGIVDEHLDPGAQLVDLRRQPVAIGGDGEIGRDRHRRFRTAELVREMAGRSSRRATIATR